MAAMNGYHPQGEDDSQDDEYELTASSIQINTKQDVEEFMRSMQLDFLRVVDPREYGLLDLMTQHDLLTDTDLESLSGKDVHIRKDQARKAWFHLRGLTPEQFKRGVLPFLCKWYPHVIPRDWTSRSGGTRHSKYCLRHDITGKVRPGAMADLLFNCGCVDIERYKAITEQENQRVWPFLLDVMTSQHPDDVMTELCDGLRQMLIRKKRRVPDDLPYLLSRGLVCTCEKNHATDMAPPGAPNTSTAVNHKVKQWLQRLPESEDAESKAGLSSAGYPEVDCSSVSSDETTCTVRPLHRTKKQEKPRANTSVKIWAEKNNLTDDTVQALVQHDFLTLGDVSMLSENDVTELMKTNGLSVKQCVLLKKALEETRWCMNRAAFWLLSLCYPGSET